MATSAEEIDIDALASTFLLARAPSKVKAKSWIPASWPDESEPEVELAKNADVDSDDELAGVGLAKSIKPDVLANRNLASSNDHLRRTLMDKKAYSKFQQGKKNRLEPSKPMPKQVRKKVDDDGDEDEEKGRSLKGAQKRKQLHDDDDEDSRTPSSKKRPLSYADEIIASRAKKKKAKLNG